MNMLTYSSTFSEGNNVRHRPPQEMCTPVSTQSLNWHSLPLSYLISNAALEGVSRIYLWIGSRRKRAIIYDKLMEEGVTRDDLDRVHSPIGLDIAAETPEEIAVSIVAELIKFRAGS